MSDAKKGREFTPREITEMKATLEEPANREQVRHCFSQLLRFTLAACGGNDFNALQFGYNLGRMQEILQPSVKTGSAGRDCWWRRIEHLVREKNYVTLAALLASIHYRLFGE
jgi:hypothetical protein